MIFLQFSCFPDMRAPSDQSNAETSLPNNTQHSQQTALHVPCRTWNHIPSNWATNISTILNISSYHIGSLSTEWYLMMKTQDPF